MNEAELEQLQDDMAMLGAVSVIHPAVESLRIGLQPDSREFKLLSGIMTDLSAVGEICAERVEELGR